MDYNLPSTADRLFLINLKDGSVEKHKVSHGVNSSGKGPLRNYAVKYTNQPSTNTSSHGAFLTGESYHGTFGYSLRVDGQQQGINSNARKRAIVIHPFDKVTKSKAEDTWGCFGLSRSVSKSIINKTKNGSVWYTEPYKG
ncbi:MAG: murein L,D-transpeptidase catalytic domain family protein [Bdellovibrionales bacterium]|nr:murein L,D-transpeptidase catalytic domain family protein [Bdellovibrionales bacterium]